MSKFLVILLIITFYVEIDVFQVIYQVISTLFTLSDKILKDTVRPLRKYVIHKMAFFQHPSLHVTLCHLIPLPPVSFNKKVTKHGMKLKKISFYI